VAVLSIHIAGIMRFSKTIISAALLLGVANAEDASATLSEMMKLDADGDGMLTMMELDREVAEDPEEAKHFPGEADKDPVHEDNDDEEDYHEAVKYSFVTSDRNRDGKLDHAELTQFAAMMDHAKEERKASLLEMDEELNEATETAKELMKQHDADGDGKLGITEISKLVAEADMEEQQHAKEAFDESDKNEDGKLDRAELVQFVAMMNHAEEEALEEAHKESLLEAEEDAEAEEEAAQDAKEMMKHMDADGDGMLTLMEINKEAAEDPEEAKKEEIDEKAEKIQKALKYSFVTSDRNNDGKLDRAELVQLVAMMSDAEEEMKEM